MSSDHDTPIKTPKQLITVIALSFIVPIIIIVLLVSFVNSQSRKGSGTDASAAKAVDQRIKPLAGLELRDANAPRVLRAGEEVYKAQCAACHTAGVAGAPKLGDAAGWAARVKTGYDSLLNSALKGKGAEIVLSPSEWDSYGWYADFQIGSARLTFNVPNCNSPKLLALFIKSQVT